MKSIKSSLWRAMGRYGTVGLELVLSIFIGYYGGRWLDAKLAGGHGWLTIAGVVAGVYAGFRSLFKAAKAMQRDVETIEREEAKERERWARGERGDDDDGDEHR